MEPTPTPISPPDDALFERYVAGDCTPAEVEAVEAWMRQAPREGAVVRWMAGRFSEPVVRARADIGRAQAIFAQRITGQALARRLPAVRRRLVMRTWLAAGIVVAAFVVVTIPAFRKILTPAPKAYSYETKRAEQLSVLLPDGSSVTLAPETKLRFMVDGNNTRYVELTGQALFTVRHDPDHPFHVRARDALVRVLGTTFDVRHYPTDSATYVTVESGKVEAGNARHAIVLTPGTLARVTDSTATQIATGDQRTSVSWTNGRLTFTKAPISAVLETLQRWFGYEFRIADSTLAKQHVTVGLSIDKPDEAIAILQDILEVTVTLDGNVVTLQPRRNAGRGTPPRITPQYWRERNTVAKTSLTEVGK